MLTAKITLSGFSDQHQTKIKTAINLALKALNSPEFKADVLGFQYVVNECSGHLWWRKCTSHIVKSFHFAADEDAYTNQQVFDLIMGGSELNKPDTDSCMNIDLVCEYGGRGNVTAYGYPEDNIIHLYASWVDQAEISELANTIVHEWTHKVRFEHEFNYTYERQYSVPYGIGDIVENIIDKHLSEWAPAAQSA